MKTDKTNLNNININTILNLPTEELKILMGKIQYETKARREEKVRLVSSEHDKLVGRCFKVKNQPRSGMFPKMWKYYKIISSRADSEYSVSVLTFDEYPTYWFEYQNSGYQHLGDFYFGNYDFESIVIEEKNAAYFDLLTEISPEEYNEAMNLYINRLQEMSWPVRHYRYGNKKPGDLDWEIKSYDE